MVFTYTERFEQFFKLFIRVQNFFITVITRNAKLKYHKSLFTGYRFGYSPLFEAVQHKHDTVCKHLRSAGAKLSMTKEMEVV